MWDMCDGNTIYYIYLDGWSRSSAGGGHTHSLDQLHLIRPIRPTHTQFARLGHSLAHSVTHSVSLTQSLTHSSLTRSLTCSLTQLHSTPTRTHALTPHALSHSLSHNAVQKCGAVRGSAVQFGGVQCNGAVLKFEVCVQLFAGCSVCGSVCFGQAVCLCRLWIGRLVDWWIDGLVLVVAAGWRWRPDDTVRRPIGQLANRLIGRSVGQSGNISGFRAVLSGFRAIGSPGRLRCMISRLARRAQCEFVICDAIISLP